MSRKRIEIDPECGRRLKSLLAKNKVTQRFIANKLNYQPQHISSVVRGVRRLTPELAQRIVLEVFPGVNVEWLLNQCEFETIAEKENHSKKVWEENQKLTMFHDRVFRAFIDGLEDLCGYGLHSQDTDSLIGDYIAVSDSSGKIVGAISVESFDMLRSEIENFASFSIGRLIKNKMMAIPQSAMDGESNG